jgi:hypothetical protein
MPADAVVIVALICAFFAIFAVTLAAVTWRTNRP